MLITFKRYGHANNSSSSHSIIFAPHLIESNDNYYPNEFGWDTFTLTSRRAKESYLLIQWFQTNGEKFFSYETVRKESTDKGLESVFYEIKNYNNKVNVFKYLDDIYENDLKNRDFYIDHQSVITWPNDKITGKVSLEFFFDLSHEILNNDYLVLGGNDNDGEHPLSQDGLNKKNAFIELYNAIVDQGQGNVTCYKDIVTKEWTISNTSQYSRYNGSLLKVVFGIDIPSDVNMNDPKIFFSDEKINFFKKSSTPYLVDLKINSYCSFGCEFCYTSSTVEGSHADADYIILHLLEILHEAKVFEIVLGGGEPTTHPRLFDIVEQAKKFGFKTGITTKNYKFHNHPDVKKILAKTDSIAFSINNYDELKKAVKCVNDLKSYKETPQFYMQTILGLHDWQTTLELCEEAQKTFRFITFLGYKSFGFGKNVKSNIVDKNWYNDINAFSKQYNVNIGIDSIIANKYREELTAQLVDWNYLVGSEGKASCFVDAVESKIAASSFTDENIAFNFREHGVLGADKFLEIFKTF